jgi:hypothetical protein
VKFFKSLLIVSSLVLAFTATASDQDKCESREHNVAHSIKGKDYVCDKCVVLSCESSGKTIGKCTRTTKYTECVEAAPKPAPKPEKKK